MNNAGQKNDWRINKATMAEKIILEGCGWNRKYIRNDLTHTFYEYTVLYWVDDRLDTDYWWDFEYTEFNGFQLEVWE